MLAIDFWLSMKYFSFCGTGDLTFKIWPLKLSGFGYALGLS
jgi:hypothetical protein